eukprot:1155200-Pelagomonas_calceolata.AAC.1
MICHTLTLLDTCQWGCPLTRISTCNLPLKKPSGLRASLAGMARTCTFAHQHQLTQRLHAYLWLLKTCHSGTTSCHPDRHVFCSDSGKPLTLTSVQHECGIGAIQFNWFTVHLHNSLIHCSS